MISRELQADLRGFLQTLENDGLYKHERVMQGPQGREIEVNGRNVLNF